jgi:FtsP/CotA-like multicopper oxidase with cupredoxin domain
MRMRSFIVLLVAGLGALLASTGRANVFVQCPAAADGDMDGIPRFHLNGTEIDPGDPAAPGSVKCMHLTGGDGFVRMGNEDEIYIFGFSDVSNVPPGEVLDIGIFRANSPAPTIRIREGDELYLTLTNVGTHIRPDLFDPHTVHYHGFPNASAIFDGLPESGVSINQQASITYYYNNVEPGTYMWHCHVEATEHMQMGMLGNLYVEPAQNRTGCLPPGTCPIARKEGNPDPGAPLGYVYNDGDGSTAYDVEYVLQMQAFDGPFHDLHQGVQPLPFAEMRDTHMTLNGRSYPHTTVEGPLPVLATNGTSADEDSYGVGSPQPVSALIRATQGQRVLLRMSNLGVVKHYTLSVLGIPMRVVGRGARLLRGPGGQSVAYDTNAVTLGGGESADVILDTADVAPGTYFLYATNLYARSNMEEDNGGYMTEIVVEP